MSLQQIGGKASAHHSLLQLIDQRYGRVPRARALEMLSNSLMLPCARRLHECRPNDCSSCINRSTRGPAIMSTDAISIDSAAVSSELLLPAWTRVPCPSCKRSYKFYCPVCCIAIGKPQDVVVPSLGLPLQVHIWFQDKVKKSTAPHAKVLAPKDVQIIQYPLPETNGSDGEQAAPMYTREDTVVVYPSYESETLADLTAEDLQQLKTLVFIDCPWQKAPVILQDSVLANVRCVKLAKPPLESKFWRYHKAGKGCVSTIEAIQLMLEEYVEAAQTAKVPLREGSENTQMTDLLFFFKLLYCQIVDSYDREVKAKPPMDEEEKERQRLMHDQREKGKKRRVENKLEHWQRITHAIETGEMTERPRNGRCFNCKQREHEAKACPQPCRYCKDPGHWSGVCENKKARHESELKQQIPITKAL